MFNKLSSLSLKYKVSGAIAALVLILLLLAGTLINTVNRAETKEANQVLIKASFDDVKQVISLFIESRWNDLKDLADDGLPTNAKLLFKVDNFLNQSGQKIYEAIFVLDSTGTVVASSDSALLGQNFSDKDIFNASKNGTHFEIQTQGDEVMGYFSLTKGAYTYIAKINNDRISDLAQSARPYPASSDNYLFTLTESKLGPAGTAISRSAFEADLIKGIDIKNGQVKVEKNTELELKFWDPETNKPTIGVQTLIDKGEITNLEGYPDYRHISVVGVGGLITYADDFTAGLLSEADLKGIDVGIHGKDEKMLNYLIVFGLILLVLCAVAGTLIAVYLSKRVSTILEFTTKSDDLEFRLAKQDADELGKLAEGINDFLENREHIMSEVNAATVEAQKLANEGLRYQQMIDGMPINVLMANLDGKIISANPSSIKTLKTLEHLLPIKAEELVGQSYDIFHRDPSKQRKILANPANLPHKAIIEVGPEKLDLLINPIYDQAGAYTGAMLTWAVVTEQLRAKEQEDRVKRELEQTVRTLSGSSKNLETSSESLSINVNRISESSSDVQNYINSVSVATEEMISSISEISKNTDKAAKMTQDAVAQMSDTEGIIRTLRDRSEEIASILKVVTEIANQTNLLALNATIEAARAGDAGKGFAVVANEVKELANRTAEATGDIGNKISAMQQESLSALAAIETASVSVKTINEVAITIAGSVEEQTAVTAEIGKSMRSSTERVTEMAHGIGSVTDVVKANIDSTLEINKVTNQLETLIK